METLVLTIHVIACILLIAIVLLQSGHEGMGVIFGGGSGSMFGSSGAGGLLVKITAGLAVVFLFTSLAYNALISRELTGGDSLMLQPGAAESVPAPEKGITFQDTEVEKDAESN